MVVLFRVHVGCGRRFHFHSLEKYLEQAVGAREIRILNVRGTERVELVSIGRDQATRRRELFLARQYRANLVDQQVESVRARRVD